MEYVTTVRLGGPNPAGRRLVRALEQRLGDGKQIRAANSRSADAARLLLAAAASRLALQAVAQHVCRHDEGIGGCS